MAEGPAEKDYFTIHRPETLLMHMRPMPITIGYGIADFLCIVV